MKKYSETQNEKPINWIDEIHKAKSLPNGPELDALVAELASASSSWVTCAVGNQCDIIPRYSAGCPVNGQLIKLGSSFYELIKMRKWERALETLGLIEKRSAQVIAEIYSKNVVDSGN